MPPFYIGYTLTNKIVNGSYHGSVTSYRYKQIWQQELFDNPDLFKTVPLTFHESALEAKNREQELQEHFQVHRNPMYINMAISGKRMIRGPMSNEEKVRLTAARRAYGYPDELRQKMSVSARRKPPVTDETKLKQSKARKGKPKSVEHGRKIGDAHIGMKRSDEAKRNISQGCLARPKAYCPHCGIFASKGNLAKWHMDRCKSIHQNLVKEL